MGAGKSTKSKELAKKYNAILLSEDEWLATIYPDEIKDLSDYLKYSSRLKPLVKKHVQNILKCGLTVVMDFPGNTQNQRAWFKEIYSEYDFPHTLVYLEANDSLCLKRIEKRRMMYPQRAQFDTEAVFYQVTSYFEHPSEKEGFNIEVINTE